MSTTQTFTAGIFTGYTLSELRALTLRILRQGDTSRYSPTAGTADYDWIDDALNRGQEDFVRKTLCLRTYAVVELKANYRTYRLPSDFLDMITAFFYTSSSSDGYYELTVRTIEELNNQASDWRTKLGNPTDIYVDRTYGQNWMFGVYPIPASDGGTITFDSEYGSVVQWVCPLYTYSQEYGTVLRMTDTDEFFLNMDNGVIAKVYAMSGNIWLEYYRLPMTMQLTTQYPELPKEYHKALAYYAAWDMLQHNPEDSAEFKRSMVYEKRFNEEVGGYIRKRKAPLKAQTLMARAASWGWLNNMEWYSTHP